MAAPVLKVEIDLANGPSFSYPLILNNLSYGILDINTLGDQAANIVDISDMVMRCSTRRGRNRILANFEAGSATVTINDPNSDFNPQNTASQYYPYLIPLRKIRIYAETTDGGNPVEVNLFAGYITSYDTGFYSGVYDTSTVTLQCVDGFRLLNNVSTGADPIPGCTAGQLSGTRVNEILDFANWPGSQRLVNQGNSTMQVDPGQARSILAAIQTVEQSEFGAFFMSRAGKTTFLERYTLSKRAALAPRYYTDTPTSPTQFTYANLDFAFDDQLILNDVTVTRNNDGVGPALPQNWDNAASKLKFFTKSGQRTGILVQDDTESLNQAQTLVTARKNAELRIESFTVNMYATTSEANSLINLTSDIYDLVFVRKSMSGPTPNTMEQELFIQGVQHDITPTTWNIKLLTAEPLIQAFILDSDDIGSDPVFQGQGILGNTVPQNTNVLSY